MYVSQFLAWRKLLVILALVIIMMTVLMVS